MKLGRIALLVCLLVAGAGLVGLPVSQAADDLPVYTDALATGWQDWDYNDVTRNYANASPVHAGSASIAVTCNEDWSALQIGYYSGNLDVSAYDTLRFWINGGSQGGQQIDLQIDYNTIQSITLQANTWTRVDVSL